MYNENVSIRPTTYVVDFGAGDNNDGNEFLDVAVLRDYDDKLSHKTTEENWGI